MYMGTGGSIPFMGMLGEKFPGTQFLITGVLGPEFERARAERVPAYRHGPQSDRLRLAGARGSRGARQGAEARRLSVTRLAAKAADAGRQPAAGVFDPAAQLADVDAAGSLPRP